MLFNKVKEGIIKNKRIKEEGGYVGIPFPFKRMADYYPVIDRGHSIGILAGTGVGKSRLTRFLGIYHPYKFYKETGYNLKIFYFPLEDNKEKVYKNIICNYLWVEHNIKVSPSELDSKGARALPEFVVTKIIEAEQYFADFEKVVTIIDGFTEPKDIYKVLEKYLRSVGTIKKYIVDIDGNKEEQLIYDSEIHTLVVIDNMANVDKSDEHMNERAAMVELSKIYVRERLCNFFKCSVITVLQNDFVTERQQFNASGKSIMSKVEPSLASIGEAKTVARSMHVIFTLFNPSAFDFIRYPAVSEEHAEKAYDIGVLGNRFRALKIIKNNDGDTGIRVGLYFDAITETFDELPAPDSPEMKQVYGKFNVSSPKFTKSNVIVFEEDYTEEAPF